MSKKKIKNGVPIPDFKAPDDKPPKAAKDLFVGGPLDGQIKKVVSTTGFFTTPMGGSKQNGVLEQMFCSYTYRRVDPEIVEGNESVRWSIWLGEDVSITQLWDKLTNAYVTKPITTIPSVTAAASKAMLDAAKDMTIVSASPQVVPTDFGALASGVLSQHEWDILQKAALRTKRFMKPKPMVPIPTIRSRHILPAKPQQSAESSVRPN